MAQGVTDCDCVNSFGAGSVVDSVTGQCVQGCPDGSRPANGQCTGEPLSARPELVCGGGMSTIEKVALAAVAVGVGIMLIGKKGGRRRR